MVARSNCGLANPIGGKTRTSVGTARRILKIDDSGSSLVILGKCPLSSSGKLNEIDDIENLYASFYTFYPPDFALWDPWDPPWDPWDPWDPLKLGTVDS